MRSGLKDVKEVARQQGNVTHALGIWRFLGMELIFAGVGDSTELLKPCHGLHLQGVGVIRKDTCQFKAFGD